MNAESLRNNHPWGRSNQLVIQYLMFSPEYTHTSNINYTDWEGDIHLCIYTYSYNNNVKEAMNVQERREGL